MTSPSRTAIVAWSALVFGLFGPAAGYQFWALVQFPPQLILFSPSLTWAMAFGWPPALAAGIAFGAAIALQPPRRRSLFVAPPLWAALARFGLLGALAGLAGCAVAAFAAFPPGRYANAYYAARQLLDGAALLAWFGVPAGALCGMAMLPVLRALNPPSDGTKLNQDAGATQAQ
ncbi:MAG TPA: hypothetical protein VLW45_08220 [Pelomicrobium sp.]|nr:hypothetical protein [Pelomicrobium sp.]